jgi:hypothetical protein
MAMTARRATKPLVGSATPRIGPPPPLHHGLAEYRQAAADLDIDPMPWQDTAAMYLTARGPDGSWLYREVAAVVGRQNGKTTLTKPLIVQRLKAGRHIMHIAQVRELPRIMFEAIADALEASDPGLFPKRRGKIIWPRRGAGSESIVLTNGGSYRIAAAVRGSARGHSIDDLLIDELREMDSFDVVNSAKPAQRFSADPQTIYLSNMGTDESVVLNSLISRSSRDPSLAYLEWSADPEYSADDRRGWVQSNPAIGHYPQVLRDLENDYTAAKLGGNMAGFETEALCRKAPSMRETLVDEFAWARSRYDELEGPRRSSLAFSMSPDGRRASCAVAWLRDDLTVGLRVLYDVTGNPIDTALLGKDLALTASRLGIRSPGFDPLTDKELAKYFKKPIPIAGQLFANASAQFVNLVNADHIRHRDCEPVTDDLTWTSRKQDTDTGSYQAVRASDDRSITASLAAIRAVWLASGPKPASPKVM